MQHAQMCVVTHYTAKHASDEHVGQTIITDLAEMWQLIWSK
jgi:hypothetical protein